MVLRFIARDGAPYPADDVLEAEGRVVIAGTPMVFRQDALVADLTDEKFRTAIDSDTLRNLFLRHHVLAIKPQPGEGNIRLMVEPGYVAARDVVVQIVNGQKAPVRDCKLSLEVPSARQLGRGWDRISGMQSRKIPLTAGPDTYRVPPATAAALFIWLANDLPGVKLLNENPGCLLAAQSPVDLRELRDRMVTRKTEVSGPVLIAGLTTDANMKAMLPSSPEQFWTQALSVYDRVATAGWRTRILIRGQSPGFQTNLRLLATSGDVALLREDRSRTVALLNEASAVNAGQAAPPSPPVVRRELPFFLRDGRLLSRLDPKRSAGQEAFLFISGSVKTQESDLCSFIRGQRPDNATFDWLSPLRKAAFIELWDDKTAYAHAPSDAAGTISPPTGVSLCRGQGERSNLILYGVNAASLTNPETNTAIFAFLSENALIFLRP